MHPQMFIQPGALGPFIGIPDGSGGPPAVVEPEFYRNFPVARQAGSRNVWYLPSVKTVAYSEFFN